MKQSIFSMKSMVMAGLLACVPVVGANAASLVLVESGDATLADANISVNTGSTFSLELWGIGFPANIDGGTAGFTYDVDTFTVNGFTAGATSDFGTTADDGAGTVSSDLYATGISAAGNVLLGTYSFTADAVGTSILSLFEDSVSPFSFGYSTECFSGCGNVVDTLTLGTATIAVVSAVPIPPAIWLLGSALVGLMGLSRRKAQAVAAVA